MRDTTSASVGVVGSANVDLVVRVRSLPLAGETVLGDDLRQLSGGKGANQAAASAVLGAATTFIGAVGSNANGTWLIDQLAQRGVRTEEVRRSSQPTGTALIVVDDAGENTIVVAPGANATLSLDGTDVAAFDVVLAQLEIPLDTVVDAARRAKRFVLNAAPARDIPDELLERSAVVIVNETEAAHIDVSRVSHLVVTLGARGAQYLIDGVVVATAQPPAVDVVDTVGAGDTFCAAFCVQLALGASPQEALSYAVTAGALATLNVGAQGSLPTHEEVLAWLPPEL